MKFLNKISNLYWRHIADPVKYACHIGVSIGDNCLIDTRNWPSEPYLISIGNNVQLTHGVSIYTHGGGHPLRNKYPDFDLFGKVVIEDWVYVGAFSIILPGVVIGEGSIIGAGSVVTKSVPPHTVVAGNPARIICTTEEFYERNKHYNLGTKGLDSQRKKDYLLHLPDNKFIQK